jgi:prepilin-type N-terminal cleavage/methylation domain-containing protein
MINNFKNQAGFTLIEMLIVIVVLGILAMIIVPQIGVSTEDAKLRTLQTNLSGIRSTVETYYAQHNSVYPGKKKHTDGTDAAVGDVPAAFEAQLTLYSKANGETFHTKDTTDFKYGPYVKGGALPVNPFTSVNDVAANMSFNITDRDADLGTDKGWKFYPNTGVFIANDTDAHATH